MVDPISRDENGSVLKAHLTTAQDLDSLLGRSSGRHVFLLAAESRKRTGKDALWHKNIHAIPPAPG